MNWIINDPAFMGYIRELEGEDDVDTRDAMIERVIKYLVNEPYWNTNRAMNVALAVAGFDPFDSLTIEELTYVRQEVAKRHI
jgi:hypothetical protein